MPISRTRRFLGFLAMHGPTLLLVGAALSSFATMLIVVGPVLNRAGDDLYHILNEYVLARAVREGDNPFGPLGMEFGQPVLRFYQALFYLHTLGWNLVAGLDIRFVHNTTIVICFAASPFAYAYFLRKLGMDRWTAALGGFLSMISVAAFGNSFEAYFEAGIVTQSMGGLFLPWFMGHFIGMLRGENRPTTTAFLFAVAFLSHAIMSVFAAFACALYVGVAHVGLFRNWKRLAVFGALGVALIAFWAIPFVEHTYKMRPVPDSIIRGRGVHWFTSVSTSELAMVLGTGRLLDDPPRKGDARDANDKIMDKISIIGTLKTRPPVLTVLTLLGTLVALGGLRLASRRFLVAGFAFSLMLFAGPDDFPWLRFLPFIKQIQTFRCTYLVEFFAFGLAALAVRTIGSAALNLIATRRGRRTASVLGWIFAVFTTAFVGLGITEIVLVGAVHMNVRNTPELDDVVDASRTAPNGGYPFRISPRAKAGITSKIRQAWLGVHGFVPYCTHWKGTGPTAAYHICTNTGGPSRAGALHALLGTRYYVGPDKELKSFIDALDRDRAPLFEILPSGKSRRTKKPVPLKLIDSRHDSFLRPLVGRPVPVVCSNDHWIWIVKSWLSKYRSNLWDTETPIPMRVPAGQLAASGLLEVADTVIHLDAAHIGEDGAALAKLSDKVNVIASGTAPGVRTSPPGGRSIWDRIAPRRPTPNGGDGERQELDPGFARTEIEMLDLGRNSFQKFVFDVDTLEPTVALLPMEAVPGWSAVLDGKPMPVFPAGPDMVGVHLPSGAHRLELRWEMTPLHVASLLATLTALALVLMTWMWRGARAARSSSGRR